MPHKRHRKNNARCTDNDYFVIKSLTDEIQPIIGQRTTTWRWSVTPQKYGEQKLILNVYLVIPSNSGESSSTRYIDEPEKEIKVEVSSNMQNRN